MNTTEMDSVKRNLWTRKETLAVLKIFKDRNILSQLLRKPNQTMKIFLSVEKMMNGMGFHQKTCVQIMRKWKKLKSTYRVNFKPDATENDMLIPYFSEVHELMTSQNHETPNGMDETDDQLDLDSSAITSDGGKQLDEPDLKTRPSQSPFDPFPDNDQPLIQAASQLSSAAVTMAEKRLDEKRNLWSNAETMAMLEIFQKYNIASALKSMRKGNMEVYDMVSKRMNECGHNKKNSTQIRIKWKRLKSCYYKAKRGISQDVIRSTEMMSMMEVICEAAFQTTEYAAATQTKEEPLDIRGRFCFHSNVNEKFI